MKTMLITGGSGDLARAFQDFFKSNMKILSPSSQELDVSDKIQVREYLQDKAINVLVNNAGTIHPKSILESDEDSWERDIRVNLIGAYFVTKKVLENRSNALIINIASTAAFNAYSNWSSYCASKAGLVTLTKCLANDNYNAYVLCPGAVNTKFRAGLGLDNSNAMEATEVVSQLQNILDGQYQSGDVIFFRKNEVSINPRF
ncbi:MAG: SDR family oxidoreductase [Pseudomonadales bacterium]|nr:SDR family oxidoreductase [Pseudomonadales bacterium]